MNSGTRLLMFFALAIAAAVAVFIFRGGLTPTPPAPPPAATARTAGTDVVAVAPPEKPAEPLPPAPADPEDEGPATEAGPRAVLLLTVVAEENEAPLPGAALVVFRGGTVDGMSMMHAGAEYEPLARGETAGDGTFRCADLPAGEILTVRAAMAGRSAAQESFRLDADAAEPRALTLRLAPAGALYGVVRTADGRPAAGARVYAIPGDMADLVVMPDATRSSDRGPVTPPRTETAADGTWRIDGLQLDAGWIALAVLDFTGRSEPVPDLVPTLERREIPVDLVVRKDGFLTVKVLLPDGSPAAGAKVMAWGGGFPEREETGDDGTARFPVTATGEWDVRVDMDGFQHLRRRVPVEQFADSTVELTVSRGGVLAGVLVDDRGTPIPNQKLIVDRHWADEGLDPSRGEATTDGEGRFRMEGLGDGPHHVILVLADHDLPDAYRVRAPDPEARIVAPRKARLRATLVPPEGASPPADGDGMEVWVEYDEAGARNGQMVRSTVEGGVLTTDPFPAGPSHLRIVMKEFLPVLRDLDTAPGSVTDLGPLILDPGVELRGHVADATGRAVAGATVTADGFPSFDPPTATTGADGRFVLPHQPRGTVDIQVEAEGFLDGHISAATASTASIVLYRGALLRGLVRNAAGAPLAGAEVSVESGPPVDEGSGGEIVDDGTSPEEPDIVDEVAGEEEPVWESTETNPRGRWSLRVPAGTYTVTLYDDEGEPADHVEVTVAEGEEKDVRLAPRRR